MKDTTHKPEVVWILGASGAGKATFIHTITSHPTAHLLQQFGWPGRRIVVCQESLDLLSQSDNDPVIKRREVILQNVPKLLRDADVVLIKGQDWDIDADRLRHLKAALPHARHRIIFVRCMLATLYRRMRRKRWWRPFMTRQLAMRWLSWQVAELHKLENEFEIVAIDGGSGHYYRTVAFTKAGLPSPKHLVRPRRFAIRRKHPTFSARF